MDAIRRTSTLRRVATTASLAALLLTPGAADAKKKKPKSPVITSVSPMKATVGDSLIIKGKNFRKGKGKNSVGFKRSGAAVVFVKAGVSTTRVMSVKLPSRLEKVMYGGQPAQFALRVLAKRFGKSYTSKRLSPTIAPRPPKDDTAAPSDPANPSGGPVPTDPNNPSAPAFNPAGPDGDCDNDKVLNKDETTNDLDDDFLTDSLEAGDEKSLGTDPCNDDTDGDGVIDGYEYKSAVDLNNDEYQNPQKSIPYPFEGGYPKGNPYPSPLVKDADIDYDGDSLTLGEEHTLWSHPDFGGRFVGETPQQFKDTHLTYSDGLQYSAYTIDDSGHRVPALDVASYEEPSGRRGAFVAWANGSGYLQVTSPLDAGWTVATVPVDIRDVNRDGTTSGADPAETCDADGQVYERFSYDFDCNGYLADDERDEDADGLTNYDEAHGPMSGQEWWTSCYANEQSYKVAYAGTDLADPDSDDDGVLDGADDQDHDDLPNMMELSRRDASRGQIWKNAIPDPDVEGAYLDKAYPNGFDETDGTDCSPAEDLDEKAPVHADNYGKVQPFDPCDPNPRSRTCVRHPEFGTQADPDWWALQ